MSFSLTSLHTALVEAAEAGTLNTQFVAKYVTLKAESSTLSEEDDAKTTATSAWPQNFNFDITGTLKKFVGTLDSSLVVELNGRVEGTLVGVETLAAVTRCNLQVHNTKAMLTAIMTKVEDDSVIYAVFYATPGLKTKLDPTTKTGTGVINQA